jgi:rifampin ADP-ribosylating transferase
VIGEVTTWEGHSPERLAEMRALLARLDAEGVEAID